MKQLDYRGFVIKEEGDYLNIYKNGNYVKRVFANWKSGLTEAKATIDKLIKRQ